MKYRVVERFGTAERRFVLQWRDLFSWRDSEFGPYDSHEEAARRARQQIGSDGYRVVWP